jgi:hypothetical protein
MKEWPNPARSPTITAAFARRFRHPERNPAVTPGDLIVLKPTLATLLSALAVMSRPAPSPAANPRPHPDAVVAIGPARFTVLTAGLIRMEWSADATFEDRASFAFVNRHLPVPRYRVLRDDDELRIITDRLALRYLPDGKPFGPENLSIEVRVGKQTTRWTPGTPNRGNLRGTTRTLDGVSGACSLEPGLISRDGWTLIDDSQRLLFDDAPPHWAVPRSPAKSLDWYFFAYGLDYPQALRDFTAVAGPIPLPPRWAFGAWWSRYWAYSDDELKTLVGEFDAHDVPLDVLVIDMDWHLDGWTGYSWNPQFFPDPAGFLDWTEKQGLKATLNLHPHDGVGGHEARFAEFARAVGQDPQQIDRVPFDCADPDYMRAYFEILHHPKERMGVDFWWLDWQQGEASRIPGLDPLFWLNHLHWRDMATNPDRAGKRPLIFSRWGGLGNHRYQIGFSGDTFCNWASLAFQPYFTATAGNVGFAYWSHDIGGHQPGPVDPELYTRWVQFGVFSPILRTHTTKNPAAERRIWEFPKPYVEAMRAAFKLRYELIPYIYTMARKCYDTGMPLCRPLYYHWPELAEAYEHPGQYMFGDDLLVAPVTKPANKVTGYADQKVWLPPGRWINWFTDDMYDGPCTAYVQVGLDEIPVFARAGAIIPAARAGNRSHQASDDLVVLHVFPGKSGEAVLYEDDGEASDYRSKGSRSTRFSAEYVGDAYEISIQPTGGAAEQDLADRAFEFRCHTFFAEFLLADSVILNGRPVEEASRPGEPGWFYDVDRMQFVVRTPRLPVDTAHQLKLVQDFTYDENPWYARGLRGRTRAIRDAAEMIGDDEHAVEKYVHPLVAEWKQPRSYAKAVTSTYLIANVLCADIQKAEIENAKRIRAIARLLGLISNVQASPTDKAGSQLAIDVAMRVGPARVLVADKWRASLAIAPPPNWELIGKPSQAAVEAKVGDPIEHQATLRSQGSMQTTQLRIDATVEVPDIATVGIPMQVTLFPSINRWHLLGPFDAPDNDRLATVFPPEKELDLTKSYTGQGGASIRWQAIERPVSADSDLTDEFFVEFHKYFGGIKYNAVAYALVYLHAPRDLEASLAFGSDDGIVIWVNDAEIYRHDVGRAYQPKEERVPVRLREGANRLLVKISQGGGMWGFGMHVETPDGKPLPEVTVKLQP